MPSFSTRAVFQWADSWPTKRKFAYEERVTLWRARSMQAAIRKGEAEAKRYAAGSGGKYLGFIQAYWMTDDVKVDGVEVFSLIRESDLLPGRYITRHFDTGGEREKRK